MADHRESDSGCDSWSFQRTVILRDWWLIKCSTEFQGKRFGVAGTEIVASVESRAMRFFTSSPIIKAFDVFTLLASDGICVILRGFLDKERIVTSGFIPQISRDFIFGFPPCWEQICNNCFKGDVLPATDINNVPSLIHQASCPFLSPCGKSTKVNLEDSPAESRDKSTVTENHPAAEINDIGGRTGGSRAVISRILLSGKSAEDERKRELSKVQNTTSDGDHGDEGLDKAKSGDVENDECETIDNDGDHGGEGLDKPEVTRASPVSLFKDFGKSSQPGKKGISKKSGLKVRITENKRKLYVGEVHNLTSDNEDHGSERLNKAKSNDIEEDERVAINDEVISPVDGCSKRHSGTDRKKSTSKKATKELLTLEDRKDKQKVTKTSLHSLSKDLNNSIKPGEKGKSKKSKSALKNDLNVVEPMNHTVSKVKEAGKNLSGKITNRKLDFDFEATPDKVARKQKTSVVSTDSLGQKRSRSGRVLVRTLEFWRNQVPVYDMDRNLIQVNKGDETTKEGHETSSLASKGIGSDSRKPKPRR